MVVARGAACSLFLIVFAAFAACVSSAPIWNNNAPWRSKIPTILHRSPKPSPSTGAAGATAAPPPSLTPRQIYKQGNWGDTPFNQTSILEMIRRVMRGVKMPDYKMLFDAFQEVLSVRTNGGVTYLLPADAVRFFNVKRKSTPAQYQRFLTYQVLKGIYGIQQLSDLDGGSQLPTVAGPNVVKMSKSGANITLLQGKAFYPTPVLLGNVLGGPSGIAHVVGWPLYPPNA